MHQHLGSETPPAPSAQSPGARPPARRRPVVPVHLLTPRCPALRRQPVSETLTPATLRTQHPRPGPGAVAAGRSPRRGACCAGRDVPGTQPIAHCETTALHTAAPRECRAETGECEGATRSRTGRNPRVGKKTPSPGGRGASAAATPAAATAEAQAVSVRRARRPGPGAQLPPAPR